MQMMRFQVCVLSMCFFVFEVSFFVFFYIKKSTKRTPAFSAFCVAKLSTLVCFLELRYDTKETPNGGKDSQDAR